MRARFARASGVCLPVLKSVDLNKHHAPMRSMLRTHELIVIAIEIAIAIQVSSLSKFIERT